MDSELETYKRLAIAELNNAFNSQVSILRNQLTANINNVNSLRISNRLKSNYINAFISAYNKQVNTLRNKLTADIREIHLLTDVPGRPRQTKKSLLVGINYKGTPSELYGCINDTKNMKSLLEDQFGYKSFLCLTDDTVKKPTRQNIITELTNLLVNSVSGDTLFFLYSGHGTCTTDLNNDELDGQDELIVPIDASSLNSCILDDELNRIIRNGLKPGVTLVALFDSCFSGTVLDLKYNYLDSTKNLQTVINPNVPETAGHVIMISGCMDSQTSADAYVNYNGQNMGAGAMTFAFLKTIQDKGPYITIRMLVESMRTILKDNEYEQIPQLSSGKAINIDSMLLPV